MAEENKTKFLQVGEAAEENTPVAAIIQINGMCGKERFFFKGEKADNIIDSLQVYQDLSCLCRMASYMGTEEDSEIAGRLDDFICSDYSIEDFDHFDFPFSIGSLKCLGWAKGEKNCELLEKEHEKKYKKK